MKRWIFITLIVSLVFGSYFIYQRYIGLYDSIKLKSEHKKVFAKFNKFEEEFGFDAKLIKKLLNPDLSAEEVLKNLKALRKEYSKAGVSRKNFKWTKANYDLWLALYNLHKNKLKRKNRIEIITEIYDRYISTYIGKVMNNTKKAELRKYQELKKKLRKKESPANVSAEEMIRLYKISEKLYTNHSKNDIWRKHQKFIQNNYSKIVKAALETKGKDAQVALQFIAITSKGVLPGKERKKLFDRIISKLEKEATINGPIIRMLKAGSKVISDK